MYRGEELSRPPSGGITILVVTMPIPANVQLSYRTQHSTKNRNVNRLVPLATLLTPVPANTGYFVKGTDMLDACASDHPMDQAQCLGYLMGVADSFAALHYVMGTSLVCLPEDVTAGQLRRVFLTYGTSHPAELEGQGRLAVEAAFVDAFPCPSE